VNPWPAETVATGPVACGTVLWTLQGRWRLTTIVKATFALVPGGVMRPVAPGPVTLRERHLDKDPGRSLVAASDLAPYLPRADVTFLGHAYAAPWGAWPGDRLWQGP
jgi:hypothetical protein